MPKKKFPLTDRLLQSKVIYENGGKIDLAKLWSINQDDHDDMDKELDPQTVTNLIKNRHER